jgi:hypothetical protein
MAGVAEFCRGVAASGGIDATSLPARLSDPKSAYRAERFSLNFAALPAGSSPGPRPARWRDPRMLPLLGARLPRPRDQRFPWPRSDTYIFAG